MVYAHAFLNVTGFVLFVYLSVWVITYAWCKKKLHMCVNLYSELHYHHFLSRPTYHIETSQNSSSISALTGWTLTACLKFRILSGKPSGKNQRRGGAAWSCRFRDFPLSSDTHCRWIIWPCCFQNSAFSTTEGTLTLWISPQRQCSHGIVLSPPWKASSDNLFTSSNYPLLLHVTFVWSKVDETKQSHFGCHAVRAEI